ncbi:MAG: DUF2953 domain-containing protein [Oscillospiraceae bacterium]|nr:DUF2953 domain-containing protein [Oscillospiraceae bacterium]
MTALKIIGVILLVFLLLGFLRLGAIVSFGEELRVRLRLGVLKVSLRGKPKKEKPPKEKKEEAPKADKPAEPKKKRSLPRPTLDEILDLLETALAALGATVRRACRRTRIDPLDVTLTIGAYDPADTAVLFGAVNAAVFALMPKVERTFDVPDPGVHLRMDYDREFPAAEGSLGISLRLCDLFAILFTLAIPLVKWFLRFKKAHKHDAPAQEGAHDTNEQKSA